MKEVWNICRLQNTNFYQHYQNLRENNKKRNIEERKRRVQQSDTTMNIRYRSKVGFIYSNVLYNSCLDDEKRKIITRWRLSSHKLRIETGRYTIPKTDLEIRLCKICQKIEDEEHAIYECRAHDTIRQKYENKLDFDSVNLQIFLNPDSIDYAYYLSKFLDEIEKNMKELDMI